MTAPRRASDGISPDGTMSRRRVSRRPHRGVRRRFRWSSRRALRPVEALLTAAVLLLLVRGDAVTVAITAGLLLVAANVDLLRPQPLQQHALQGLSRLVGALALGGLVLASALPAQAATVVTTAVATLATVVGWRAAAGMALRTARRRGHDLAPTLIIGAGPTGQLIARSLLRRPEYGMRPVGFVDRVDDDDLPLPVLGEPAELSAVLEEQGATCAVLTYGRAREEELVDVVRSCNDPRVRFFALSRFFELGVGKVDGTADVRGFPLVPLQSSIQTHASLRAKRLFDIVVGGTALVLLSPLLALAALAVRLTSPGPVLFRQERVGLGGRPFEVLKLRTMRENDDSDQTWSVDDDDRVTAVGRVLRPTHLDELPQLINVLRGDMSLVGPRPERPVFVEQFGAEIPRYWDRHRVPVGITGWAQVNGLWGDTSIEERARLDNRYIEEWSLGRDLSILARTITTLLGYRDDDADESPATARDEVPPRASDEGASPWRVSAGAAGPPEAADGDRTPDGDHVAPGTPRARVRPGSC